MVLICPFSKEKFLHYRGKTSFANICRREETRSKCQKQKIKKREPTLHTKKNIDGTGGIGEPLIG